jgi:hypothetical protein
MRPLPRLLIPVVVASTFLACLCFVSGGCVKPAGKIQSGGTGDGAGGGAATASGAGAAPAAPDTAEKPAGVPASSGTDSQASEAPKSAGKELSELPAECQEAHRKLKEMRAAIPLVFVDVERPHDEIDRDVKQAIEVAEKFLKDCAESKETPWVKSYLARDLTIRHSRQQEEISSALKTELVGKDGKLTSAQQDEIQKRVRERMQQYRERIDKLCSEVLAATAPKSEPHCNCLSVLADKAFSFTGEWERFRQQAQLYLDNSCEALFPKGQDYPYEIGMSYLMEERYQEAQKYIEGVLATRSARDERVLYNIILWEALFGLGSLEDGQELLLKIKAEYPERLKNEKLAPSLRNQYNQWHYVADFWIAFSDYALGNTDAALLGFQGFIDRVDHHELELRGQGKQIDPVLPIFRDFRARDYVEFLQGYQDQPAKADFDEGVEWVSGAPLTIAGSRGKVLAVLFRQTNDGQAAPFLVELNHLVREYPEDLAAATLSFMAGKVPEHEKKSRFEVMRQEMASLGIDLPAGFDVTEYSTVFRALEAVVGTASLIVFDHEGRPVWRHVDPRRNAVNLLDRVITRLIKVKKERGGGK